VSKSELLNDIIESRMFDIETFYDDLQHQMEPKKVEQIKKFIERMNDEEDKLKGMKKDEIKLILYNNREKIQKTIEI
jgi:hypothetical protein